MQHLKWDQCLGAPSTSSNSSTHITENHHRHISHPFFWHTHDEAICCLYHSKTVVYVVGGGTGWRWHEGGLGKAHGADQTVHVLPGGGGDRRTLKVGRREVGVDGIGWCCGQEGCLEVVDLGCFSIRGQRWWRWGWFFKSLKQALAAALPRSGTSIGYRPGSNAGIQETAISRLLSGSTSWVLSWI